MTLRIYQSTRRYISKHSNFLIHLRANCKFWSLSQPFKFSGHYMYHSSVVTIYTTKLWIFFWQHIYIFHNTLKIITDIALFDWSNGDGLFAVRKEENAGVNTGWLQSSLSEIKIRSLETFQLKWCYFRNRGALR